MDIGIREVVAADLHDLLAINNDAVPEVNDLTAGGLAALIAQSRPALIAVDADGTALGFLLLLREGAVYDSVNYRWFARRHDAFAYVDRVAVAESARRRGVGRALYRVLLPLIGRDAPVLCLEVNALPPNPASLAFHQGLGFAEVGRQQTDGGAKTVVLMERPLP